MTPLSFLLPFTHKHSSYHTGRRAPHQNKSDKSHIDGIVHPEHEQVNPNAKTQAYFNDTISLTKSMSKGLGIHSALSTKLQSITPYQQNTVNAQSNNVVRGQSGSTKTNEVNTHHIQQFDPIPLFDHVNAPVFTYHQDGTLSQPPSPSLVPIDFHLDCFDWEPEAHQRSANPTKQPNHRDSAGMGDSGYFGLGTEKPAIGGSVVHSYLLLRSWSEGDLMEIKQQLDILRDEEQQEGGNGDEGEKTVGVVGGGKDDFVSVAPAMSVKAINKAKPVVKKSGVEIENKPHGKIDQTFEMIKNDLKNFHQRNQQVKNAQFSAQNSAQKTPPENIPQNLSQNLSTVPLLTDSSSSSLRHTHQNQQHTKKDKSIKLVIPSFEEEDELKNKTKSKPLTNKELKRITRTHLQQFNNPPPAASQILMSLPTLPQSNSIPQNMTPVVVGITQLAPHQQHGAQNFPNGFPQGFVYLPQQIQTQSAITPMLAQQTQRLDNATYNILENARRNTLYHLNRKQQKREKTILKQKMIAKKSKRIMSKMSQEHQLQSSQQPHQQYYKSSYQNIDGLEQGLLLDAQNNGRNILGRNIFGPKNVRSGEQIDGRFSSQFVPLSSQQLYDPLLSNNILQDNLQMSQSDDIIVPIRHDDDPQQQKPISSYFPPRKSKQDSKKERHAKPYLQFLLTKSEQLKQRNILRAQFRKERLLHQQNASHGHVNKNTSSNKPVSVQPDPMITFGFNDDTLDLMYLKTKKDPEISHFGPQATSYGVKSSQHNTSLTVSQYGKGNSGVVNPIETTTTIATTLNNNDEVSFGQTASFINTSMTIAQICMGLFCGLIVSSFGSVLAAFVFSTILLVFAASIILFIDSQDWSRDEIIAQGLKAKRQEKRLQSLFIIRTQQQQQQLQPN
jgi:hypothetical protein